MIEGTPKEVDQAEQIFNDHGVQDWSVHTAA